MVDHRRHCFGSRIGAGKQILNTIKSKPRSSLGVQRAIKAHLSKVIDANDRICHSERNIALDNMIMKFDESGARYLGTNRDWDDSATKEKCGNDCNVSV